MGAARPPGLGWHPCLSSFGVPWTCSAAGSGSTAAPAGPLLEQVGEVRKRGPTTRGSSARRVPGSQTPPRTLRSKLTLPRCRAKDLKPCEGNESRQEGSPKKAQGGPTASLQSHLSGNKGLLCRALLARPLPALGDQKLFSVWARAAGTVHQAASADHCGFPGRSAIPAARADRPAPPRLPLTSSMAATVFRHWAVRVVKLEAVGAL